MENDKRDEISSLLKVIPTVEFCCVYGSSLHPTNYDKSTMVDYILGVRDPLQWHCENLKMNRDHYGSWILRLGGPNLITQVADKIGVGVHFNPFVSYDHKVFKYGVVRLGDLVSDIMNWERFYLSDRLHKPVHILVDTLDLQNTNLYNLKAAMAAALLLMPSKFTEKELYAKICSLSYMGDLRMLFAEDKNKVMKIVQDQFGLFRTMYSPILEEYVGRDLFRFSLSGGDQANITQDCGLSSTRCLVSYLPSSVRMHMGMKLGENKIQNQFGRLVSEVVVNSRGDAAKCMESIVRRKVMVSSARQAVSVLMAVGGNNSYKYVSRKIGKAWKSWMA